MKFGGRLAAPLANEPKVNDDSASAPLRKSSLRFMPPPCSERNAEGRAEITVGFLGNDAGQVIWRDQRGREGRRACQLRHVVLVEQVLREQCQPITVGLVAKANAGVHDGVA